MRSIPTLFSILAFLGCIHGVHAQISSTPEVASPFWESLQKEVDASNLTAEAYAALGKQDWPQAEKLFETVMAEAPEFVGAYLGKAEAINAQGRNEEAEALLRTTVARFPQDPTSRTSLARLLVSKQQFSEAESLLQEALRMDRAHHILLDLGTLLLTAEERLDEAMQLLIEASQSNPGDAGTQFALGTAFERMGELESAVSQYENAVTLAPKRLAAWRTLAAAQIKAKRPRDAVGTYENAIKALPEEAILRTEAGDLHDALGEKELAGFLFRQATIIAQKEDAFPWLRQGMFFHRNGRYEEADIAYAEALARTPDAVSILNNRAALAIETEELDRVAALNLVQRALQLQPGNPELLDTQAQLLEVTGQLEQALATYEAAREKVPDSPVLRFRMARLKASLGRKDEARRELEDLLQTHASFPLRDKATALLSKLQSK